MKRDKEMKQTHQQSCQLWCAILKENGGFHSQYTNTSNTCKANTKT